MGDAAKPGSGRWFGSMVVALGRRPDLWLTGARVGARLAGRGWWRRRPFMPLPRRDYLEFRMVTMYGGDGRSIHAGDDWLEYLEWCKAWPAASR